MPGTVFKEIAEGITIRDIKKEPIKAEVDTINSLFPSVKNGLLDNTEIVLDKLKQEYNSSGISDKWIESVTINNNITLKPRTIKENLVPNVVGMGAKDAIYLLENMNLRVKLSGSGKVVEQSIPPGSRLVKGSTITIRLN